MKRQDLIRHLRAHQGHLVREGRGHSVWVNPAANQQSAVPRHREIGEYTARAIYLPPAWDSGAVTRGPTAGWQGRNT